MSEGRIQAEQQMIDELLEQDLYDTCEDCRIQTERMNDAHDDGRVALVMCDRHAREFDESPF